jgi:zinc/manganese transport system permease protein
MFAPFMVNAWTVATIVAVVAGVVGFFVVLRGAAFVADAVPTGAFAGAAGASLIGVSTLLGLFVFALAGALGIGWLSRRGRRDVATALILVVLLGFGVLFGEVLGVATNDILPIAAGGLVCALATLAIFRPLMLNSLMPELGAARGVRGGRMELLFLVIVALATSMTLPVVGALLIFSLMVGPPAAARSLTSNPVRALLVSVSMAVATVWTAIAASYETNWPVGFFVGVLGACCYVFGRLLASLRGRRIARPAMIAP